MLRKFLFIFQFWAILILTRLYTLFATARDYSNCTDSILILENFPVENAGYQYRANKWKQYFESESLKVEIQTIVESKTVFENYIKNNYQGFLLLSMRKRLRQVLKSKQYNAVVVRRELLLYNDYGKLFMEKLLLKIHPNAILDFDDDIAAAKNQPKEVDSFFGKIMAEDGNKFNNTLRTYKFFIVASNYLKSKVLNENKEISEDNILIIPTCVDYGNQFTKKYSAGQEFFVLGWIGGTHNYYLIDKILPILSELFMEKPNFKLLIIGGEKYERDVPFEVGFIEWNINTEIESLKQIDIGLMPLENTLVDMGKGGFKLIQYMGLGIVSVASAITINTEIVEDKVNSFLVNNDQEWYLTLNSILNNEWDLNEIGKKAKDKINKNYSFVANGEKYLKFIEKCVV